MKNIFNSHTLNAHPLLAGVFSLVATVVFGMTLACALGLTTPSAVFAQVADLPGIITGPCCTVVPALPPVPVPVVPPPVVPVPVVPMADLPGVITPPCCTIAPAAPSVPDPVPVPPVVPIVPPVVVPPPVVPVTPPVVPPVTPPAAIPGCMDPTATNYNPAATTQAGVTCTYGGGGGSGGPSCTLTASLSSITAGSSSNLSWTTAGAVSFVIDNGVGTSTPVAAGTTSVTPGATITYTGTATDAANARAVCMATIVVNPVGGAGGGGAGGPPPASGGGGAVSPNVTLAVLPHIGAQPLAYLYLSQIPYTGLDLGPVGTVVYWTVLTLVTLALAYFILFSGAPFAVRSAYAFGERVKGALNAPKSAPVMHASHAPASEPEEEIPEVPSYSTYEGFKSFARDGALSIEDLVKGLSREHALHPREHIAPPVPLAPAEHPAMPAAPVNVEPVTMFEHTEERVGVAPIPADIRGFASALVEGDRAAVFSGLRQQVRGGGKPEQLITSVVALLDDTYRSRVDGTRCDAAIARLTARLDTPTLERLISALTTAIDSSYTDNVTGAKLALTRALSVLGA